ncbi:MAG: DUF1080 domain-containing protein [Opitutaceae bacterium]
MKIAFFSPHRWLAATVVLQACAALFAGPWQPLFNGRDLTGWKVLNGTAPYTVRDGAIVGSTAAGSPNSFLATEKTFGDFILELEVKQEVGPSNSGVQFRGLSTAAFNNGRVHGYQCEIDPSARAWTGGIYDEARRGWLYPVSLNPPALSAYQYGSWNLIRIEAIGDSLRTWINGLPVAHVVDGMTREGFIALQVHSVSNPADAGRRVFFRNIRIQTADLTMAPADAIFVRNMNTNQVSPVEQAAGWRRLWDGATTAGWRAANGESFPSAAWRIENGELISRASSSELERPEGDGDIVATEQVGAFEFQFEFKLTEGAKSAVKYFVQDKPPAGSTSLRGFQFQLIDDQKHPDAKQGAAGNRTLASLYDLIPRERMPAGAAIVPRVGDWQHGRIVARPDGQVEHWLNGIKVVDFNRRSPLFAALVARSKYEKIERYGAVEKGWLLLSDHGYEVRFRSLKIRELK